MIKPALTRAQRRALADAYAARPHRGLQKSGVSVGWRDPTPLNGHITVVNIDCIRAAVIGYLAASRHRLSKYDIEQLIDQSLRKFVERCL